MKIWSMCFNATSTLLGVVGDSGTVHIFKLGSGKEKEDSMYETATSPSGSFDSRDNPGGGGMEGGYEAFIDGKKKRSMGYVNAAVICVPSNCYVKFHIGQTLFAVDKGHHVVNGRLSSELNKRDVGANKGFCLV